MDQSFIHVKDEYLLMNRIERVRQVYQLVLDRLLTDHRQMVPNEVKG